jgi:hypothetical protein
MYRRINNVIYREWIDTIVNNYFIQKCSFNPLKFSSYCFKCEKKTLSVGGFTHVFVDRINNRPKINTLSTIQFS